MSAPTVTAVVTAHDRVQFLPLAVRSAVEGGADEVIVVRNFSGPIAGSEGRYLDIPCPIADTLEKECRGLEAAHGDVVAFLDDDDVWDGAKVPRVRELFGSDADLVYYNNAQRPIDATGRPIQAGHRELAGPRPETFATWDGRDFSALVHGIWPGNSSSTSVRTAWARTWVPAAREAGWSADLFWLAVALLSQRRIRIDPEPLTLLRLHTQNMSHARGSTAAEFRERHRVASERFARANAVLARLARERAGPESPMTLYLERAAEGFRFFADLEAGTHPRAAARRALRTGAGSEDPGVRRAAWVTLLSPGLARRLLYRSSLRRWRLA